MQGHFFEALDRHACLAWLETQALSLLLEGLQNIRQSLRGQGRKAVTDMEMKMRLRGVAGIPDQGQYLPAPDFVSFLDAKARADGHGSLVEEEARGRLRRRGHSHAGDFLITSNTRQYLTLLLHLLGQ